MERSQRIAIWETLADHFLDTETRHLVPRSASCCVEAGLSIDEAREIWCHEVAPAVWHNLSDIAGEWACWPREWLVGQIESARRRGENRPGPDAYREYLDHVGDKHEEWLAIERCMALLQSEWPSRRALVTRRLSWLASHFFDFVPQPLGDEDALALRMLYDGSFRPVFEPLVSPAATGDGSLDACRARVEKALDT